MVFSGLLFIYFFLVIVLGVYYLLPRKFRNAFLLIASLVFYAYGEPVLVLVMALSIVINYAAGLLISRFENVPKRKRAALTVAIILNILILGVFKYTGFLTGILRMVPAFGALPIPNIVLPIGISFYTFQAMSYCIDVYRGDARPQRDFIAFADYVSLYPQLVAGPIVRYKDVEDQLLHRRENLPQFTEGVKLFLAGLAKKVLIANQMGLFWDHMSGNIAAAGTLGAWAGIIAFTFQIYFDFSGYSDMARGLGKMIGFEFRINFDYPYTSRSVTEFWRRWHISLGTWFREYVYIPLGGNRRGTRRQIINLMVVWMLTGLWHGANWNFVFWGLYYGVLLIIEKVFLLKYLKKTKILSRVYTLFLVVIGWVFFSLTDVSAIFTYLGGMFTLRTGLVGTDALAWIVAFLPLFAVAAVASTKLGHNFYERIKATRYAVPVDVTLCVLSLVLSTAAIVNESYNPFLYFRF